MEFLSFLIKRVLWSVLVLVGLSMVIFVIARVVPGDPARMALGPRATPEQVATMQAELGLDQPILQQYALFIEGLTRGDLGKSLLTERPVNDDIRETFAATFELVLCTMILAMGFGGAFLCHLCRRDAKFLSGAVAANFGRLCAAPFAHHGASAQFYGI